jgi:hypothetical protein
VSDVAYAVEVRDVSRTGARIRVRQGLMPAIGQEVTLQLASRPSVAAIVVWTRGTSAGLRFMVPLGDRLDAVHFEDLGAEYFRAILRLQIDSR